MNFLKKLDLDIFQLLNLTPERVKVLKANESIDVIHKNILEHVQKIL